MNMVTLYSTGCPRCGVLKKKLDAAGIAYAEVNDVDVMLNLGLTEVPALGVDGRLLGFMDAIHWINRQ